MDKNFITARELIRCIASRKDRVFILSKGKAITAKGIAHTSLIAMQSGRWGGDVDTTWDSSAIAIARKPAPKLVIVGEDGDVLAYLGGSKSEEEHLSPPPAAIRNANSIEGFVYACGMRRQVYKRVDDAQWVDVSAPPPLADEAVGFEDIDGFSESEVYAVGWKGEIWKRDGTGWQVFPLITNLILTAVCCAGDGSVYVAGQQGLLAKGRDSTWELLDLEAPFELDIWDLHWYRNTLYVATADALFTLVGRKLVQVDFGARRRLTCYSLSAADDVLWSVGRNDVASYDGNAWTIYT